MKFGAHVSIAGGIVKAVDRACKIGCECFQIFSRNPRGKGEQKLSPKIIKEFKQKIKEAQFSGHFYLHCPYYINLGSPNPKIWHASITYIVQDLDKVRLLQAKGLVMHLGHHMGKGLKFGIERVILGLREIFDLSGSKVCLILENTSGAGTEIGFKFEQIAKIISKLKAKGSNLGVCLDTCHAFASGYDFRNKKALDKTLKKFDKIIGLKYLKLIHVNDSKKDLGTHIDRHEHIGSGKIGIEGFRALVNYPKLKHLDLIIETPHFGQKRWDRRNLEILRELIR